MRLTLPFVTLCVPGSALQPQWAGESGLLVGLWASGGLTGSGRSAVMSRTHGSNVLLTRQLAPPRANHVRTRGRAELCFCDSASEITAACFQHSRLVSGGQLAPWCPQVCSVCQVKQDLPQRVGEPVSLRASSVPHPQKARGPLSRQPGLQVRRPRAALSLDHSSLLGSLPRGGYRAAHRTSNQEM